MREEILRGLAAARGRPEISHILTHTPYDEMLELDLLRDKCRNLEHVDGKYSVPAIDGRMSVMYRHATDYLVHPEDREIYAALMEPGTLLTRLAQAEMPGLLDAEMRWKTVGGEWRWTWHLLVSGADFGLAEGVVRCFIYDIQSIKRREAGLSGQQPSAADSQRDDLTGLLFEKSFFDLARKKARGIQGEWCMIAVDIEHYKLFQEWNGQANARLLLARCGEVLRRAEAEMDGLAGYRGQDNFCLMLPYDAARIDELFRELADIISDLSRTVGFLPIFGICKVQDPQEEILEVFNRAALTAEEGKGDYQHRVRVFDPESHRKHTDEYRLLSEYQQAMDDHELCFFLQPQCRVSTRKVVGAESLARWRRKDGRWISPAVFIPILEKYGLITSLDQYIWEEVCRWLRKWMDGGHRPVPISVNISQVDVFTIDVPDYLMSLMKKYALAPDLLKIEFTESAYVEDTAAVRETVRRLRDMGFLVLMDDFGSGYSSLNMLRSLNVDIIKLDAQFLHIDNQDERKGVSILESVVGMAKNMTTPIIVEGVETPAQVKFLTDLGCRYMQGFYFYHPMPVRDFEKLIADERRTDYRGIEFKANQELHVREFMDESMFSDSMLNSILGPVAFFLWKDGHVDIARYNQQFYLMVGIDLNELNHRIRHIEQFFHPDDQSKLFFILAQAEQDRINGAEGSVRVYRPNGTLAWINIKAYYLDEDEEHGKRFYVSNQDVTEMQYINVDIPGGYYRCANDDCFTFLYISEHFQKMTGYTVDEIRREFDNQLIRMVHPKDVDMLRAQAQRILQGTMDQLTPYRIRRKRGDYFYVAEQSRLTDLFGKPCWQGVLIDVDEEMRLRDQMRLLASFSTDSVIFVRRNPEGGRTMEVVIHGLEKPMGLDCAAFQQALNDGSFYAWLDEDREKGYGEMKAFFDRHAAFEKDISLCLPGGKKMRLHLKIERVYDERSSVEYISVLREI